MRVILRALLDSPRKPVYAYGLACDTGLNSTTVFKTLHRLASRQWAATCWAAETAKQTGSPRRRLFLLTDYGIREARALLDDSPL